MTRERAKELLPVITAWTEGKTIQFRPAGCTEWIRPIAKPDFDNECEWRVMPEPRKFFVAFSNVVKDEVFRNRNSAMCFIGRVNDPYDLIECVEVVK